jgi:hypothetical protein
MAKMPISHIQNNEEGLSVRDKLNTVIDRTNATNGVESLLDVHVNDKTNPHDVKAPQVGLDPALQPLEAQNVQAALQYLWARKGAGMVISATEPTDVETGMQWLDSTTAEVWIWDEDKWLQFPVVGADGANVQIEDRPPENAEVGDMWTDYGTTGELYIWDGRFWVSMTGDGGPKVIVGGGDENPDIELPENLVFDRVEDVDDFDKALARFISTGNTGKWGRIKTSDIETNPDVTFRDSKGRFKSTKEYEDLTDQLKVNRFLAGEIERQDEAIDAINNSGYDDAELRDLIAALPLTSSIDAPEISKDGELWYDEGRLELFVSYQDGWFPCSPLGARVEAGEALQAQILSRVEAGEAKQATIESSALKKSGSNTVNTSWRIKSDGKTIVSGAESGKIKIYHLAEPTDGDHAATKSYADGKLSKEGGSLSGILNMQDHYIAGLKTPSSGTDAANKAYVDGNFIGRSSYTNVYDDWSVRQQNADGNNRTLFSATGGELHVYNLSEPTDTHHAATKNYVDGIADLKLDLSGGTKSKMTGNLYMGGNKIAGVKAPELDTDAANKTYVDERVAGIDIPNSNGPTDKHNGNRFNVSGVESKQLSKGDVMFLQGAATVTNLGTIDGIALPENEFEWDRCAKSGVVKVMNGAELAGYFSVYDMVKNEGRNVILKVELLKLGDDYNVSYETGTPCYFHGVFFA